MNCYLVAAILLVATALPSLAVPTITADSIPHDTKPNLTQLRFVVYHPQSPPYIYTEPPNNRVIGILPELLAPFFAAQGIKLEYLLDNRAGAEQRLYKGDVDAMMLAPDWAKYPERLLFTDGIIPYYDYLFARVKKDVLLLPEQLKGKKICTREYYVYPELEARFKLGQLLRVDSSSHEAQLRMMFNKRCDLLYMNSLVADWLLQHTFSSYHLFPSDIVIGKSQLIIALHPKWLPLLEQLNAFLRQQRQNGEVQRVIDRYID
jgi:polar amino acid transport system substrate-binding protein